jgi:hypothetical protein
MIRQLVAVATVAAVLATLSGCAIIAADAMKASVVTSKSVERGRGASQIADSFTFEGSIFVFAALTWDPEKGGGSKVFEARWFNEDRLVSKQTSPPVRLTPPPYFVYFSTSGLALGPGRCHVELYVDGVLLESKKFTVSEA